LNEFSNTALATDPEHLAISKSKGIKIDWKDGHRSDYSLALLRDECPCAHCTGAHGTAPARTSYSAPAPSPFPMYKPALKMVSVEPVGTYAIHISWNDGHSSGIYSWDHLRAICRCEQCRPRK
jgi:DUF971 family protein